MPTIRCKVSNAEAPQTLTRSTEDNAPEVLIQNIAHRINLPSQLPIIYIHVCHVKLIFDFIQIPRLNLRDPVINDPATQQQSPPTRAE